MVPGRPVVSGNGCLTENISKFVDFWLKPIVKGMKSYIKDTNNFMCILENLKASPLPPGSFMVTADISAMYNNIDQQKGTDACQHFLEKSLSQNPAPVDLICRLVFFILLYNYMEFNGNFYLQIMCQELKIRSAELTFAPQELTFVEELSVRN